MLGIGSQKRERDDESYDDSDSDEDSDSLNDDKHTIHVKIFTGKTIPLKVKLSDTIGYIKTIIQHKEHIWTDQQVLILDDTVLDDIDILANFNIDKQPTVNFNIWKQPTVLKLMRKSVGLMRIFVKQINKPYNDHTFSLEVKPSDTISNVKCKIHSEHWNLPTEEQALIYNETVLDDSGTLADFHIKRDFTLTLLKSGGWINIFIKTNSAGTFYQRVKPTFTVSKLKDKIQFRVRIPPNEQALIFNDMVLEDNSTLADFYIGKDSKLTVMRKSSGIMRIFVKLGTTEIVTLEVKPSDTIAHVKTMIQRKEGYPLNRQRLIFNGRSLNNNHTLISYHIHKNNILDHLLNQPCTLQPPE